MTDTKTPLERFLSKHWGSAPEQLLSLLEQRFGVRVEPQQLTRASDPGEFASVLKDQVDHPGRLERVAERLLRSDAGDLKATARDTTW